MYKLRNIVGLCGFLLVPFFAAAQVVPEPVQFIIAPEVPGPREQVIIAIEGVGSFLGDSTITWSENDTVKLTGVGERTFSFITGALGSETRIRISINSQTQGLIERTLVFRPSTVNLIWEADTTAPLFGRGKTLYSAGSPLKVVAFPTVVVNNSLVSPQSLSFQWAHNDEPVAAQSGLGRSTLSFVGDQLQNAENVTVDVYFGAVRVGRGSVVIPAQEPVVLLYSRDPLRGEVLDSALPSAIALTDKEITVQAEPYYFSRKSLMAGLLNYAWTLNDEDLSLIHI